MANELLTPESLSALVSDARSLTREQEETNTARQNFNKIENAATIKELALTKSRQDDIAKTAKEASDVLTGMTAKAKRIDEIENSIFLRTVEPLAGVFNPKYSRTKLADSIRHDTQQLAVIQETDDLKARQINAEADVLDAQRAVAKSKLDAELGDDAAIAQRMKTVIETVSATEQLKGLMLSQASSKEEILKLMEDESLGITEREAQSEIDRLEDAKLEPLRREAEAAGLRFQTDSVTLTSATLEELQSPEWLQAHANIPAGRIRETIRTKQLQENSAIQLALNVQQAQRLERISTAQDEELKRLANTETNEDGTPNKDRQAAKEELAARTREINKDKEQSLRTAELLKQSQISNTNVFLSNTPIAQLRGYLQKALSTGTVNIPNPVDPKMNITANVEQLTRAIDSQKAALIEQQAMVQTEATIAPALNNSLKGISTALGHDFVSQKSLIENLDETIRLSDLSHDERAVLVTARGRIANATKNMAILPAESAKMLEDAWQSVATVESGIKERQLKDLADNAQKAGSQYLHRGSVQTNEAAASAISEATLSNATTGYGVYDKMLTKVNKQTSRKFVEAVDQAEQDSLIAQAQRRLDPAEITTMNITNRDLHKEWTSPITNEVLGTVYIEAARGINPRLAEEIAAGAEALRDSNGNVTLAKILDVIETSSEKGAAERVRYLTAMREMIHNVAGDATRPRGDLQSRVLMASLNRIMFGDRGAGGEFAAILEENIKNAHVGLADINRKRKETQFMSTAAQSAL